MRNIGNLLSEQDALRFTTYLRRIGIAHTCEPALEPATNYVSYQIWVHDEDRLEEAKGAFATFLQNSANVLFDIPLEERIAEKEDSLEKSETIETVVTYKRPNLLTYLVVALCALIFIINGYQELPLLEEGVPEGIFVFTPIQTACLYDLPPFFEELTQLMQKHKLSSNQQIGTLPSEVQAEIAALPHAVYWKGFYDWLILKIKTGNPSEAEGPLWVKIRQGELWRLVSPCFLHAGLLHILFNMLWVWVLCRPVEQRLGFFRLLLLTIFIAIGSNTAQYLIGGSFFLGYSGVVMGLAGFIWSRQKIAPWEGYPVQKSTLFFLLFFILAMFALQAVSFILQLFSDVQFSPNIANTAHLTGAIWGAFLGRLRFFSWRIIR